MAGGRAQCNVNVFEPLPGSVLVAARSAVQTVHVQKIIYSPAVHIDGTVLAFLDSITLQPIGVITILSTSVEPAQYVLDYSMASGAGAGAAGTPGVPLTQGANLVLSVVSGGVTGYLHIEAYQLPLFVWAPYVAPQTAGFTA